MLTLTTMLAPFGFEPDVPTRLVRHQDQRLDVEMLYREGHFETYQALQAKKAFAGCKRIVSFLGRPGTTAVFIGVYNVDDVQGPAVFPLPRGFPESEMNGRPGYRYDLSLDPRFEPLRHRVVVEWGRGTRTWVQLYRDGGKPVIEVLPEGYVREFPGFMNVLLTHEELVKVVKHRDAHREWHRMLASVAGVYLTLDTRTGEQYVGSAYGREGILGRWRQYADSTHGGNKKLRQAIADRPQFARDMQFAILQTLPVTSTSKEVIQHEVQHKRKLGTRAHGLNSN
jgi:hypothetical protein